jgi:hypothetical protein
MSAGDLDDGAGNADVGEDAVNVVVEDHCGTASGHQVFPKGASVVAAGVSHSWQKHRKTLAMRWVGSQVEPCYGVVAEDMAGIVAS